VTPIVPDGFDPSQPTPLLIMLHGYAASGVGNDIILKLDTMVSERGFIYLRPDGTFDSEGHRFWNATDACCNFYGVELDDVSYLQALIDEARARYAIDHVALIGHSNGGFMSHRFACERASSIDALASLAGLVWADAGRCRPDAPVRVLQIHGTEDPTVLFDGNPDGIVNQQGTITLEPHPGAVETVAQWAAHNGCGLTAETDADRDFSIDGEGDETHVYRHPDCYQGGAAELWALEGLAHLPNLNEAWRHDVLDFLLAR
jgi:polyhydroxybutyrate depolymerase